ncbi:M16 family metallopeptidase [Pedobacter sp. WC2423]|uniref:M16 family metallopeptidase n=1 Tax=Pedobacter sp. WC2423 TaxID=3234142 RepID=UPI0034674B17
MFKNIIRKNYCLTLLAIVGLILPIQAQKSELPLPLDPQVRRGVLPNGFTYYIRHNETPKERVVFNLIVKAGSILEDQDQSGLAHFMEHMSFNGTKHFPKNQLVDYLQKNGLRFGADINAYTGFDETVYQLPLTNDMVVLEKGLLIIRDWSQEATLDDEEINKERGVIVEEKRTQTGASQRMQEKYTPMLFNESRYAYRNPIGTDSSLHNFPPSAIKRFYTDWYRPDLQGIIAVGDIDVDQMERMIKNSFSSLKNPDHERPRTNYRIGLNGKNGFMALKDPEMNSTVAQIIIKHQAPEMKTAADYKQAIIARLFNMATNQRFKLLYTGDSAQVLRAGASISPLMGGLDKLGVNIVAKPGLLKEGVITVWTAIERIRQSGFSTGELELVKQLYRSAMDNGLSEQSNISSDSYVQEYIAHFLHGDLAPGIETEYKLVMQFLKEITIDDLDSMARAYIRTDNTDLIIMAPEGSVLPDESTFKSWMSSVHVDHPSVLSKETPGVVKPLLRLKPVPGKVVSMSTSQNGITKMKLANGVEILLKPTTFKNNEILFSGFSRGGTSVYSNSDYQSAKNAASIVSAAGAGNYGYKELEGYLLGKEMAVQPFISELSQGVSGGSNSANIAAALELVYAYLTEPVKDKALFNQMISRTKIALSGQGNNPARIFQDSIKAIMGNYNSRRMPLTVKKIDEINFERVYQIYKERFADNSGMVFTFIGSFKIDSIRPVLEKYLGGLPAVGINGTFNDPGIGLPVPGINKVIKKGVGSKANVELFFRGTFDYTLKERLRLEALKGILELRLTERLREQEHGVYSPAVILDMNKIPRQEFTLAIAFECAPENARNLIQATLQEINKLQQYGPALIDIQKFKTESMRSREINLTSNQWWLGYLVSQLEEQEHLVDDSLYLKNLNTLNQSDLKISAVKYLNNNKLSQFILMPE